MSDVYILAIGVYGLIGLVSALVGFNESKTKHNPYGLTRWLLPYGSFVWGDAVLLGSFWFVVSLICLLIRNLDLFLVTQAIFWMVRSAGEIAYWFLQQFSTVTRDSPKTLWGHNWFPGESIWFVYQVAWQLVLVLSILALTLLLTH